MINRVNAYIAENNLCEKDKPIVIALSGGVDSTVLLDVLRKLGFFLVIAHVNHHKRIESINEEAAIIEYAKAKKIPYEILQYNHTGNANFQSDAHEARYRFYEEVCAKYHTNIIATAHQADDNIETILMNLMSGSNLYGYSGIAPKVELPKMTIIRPLLFLSKKEIYAYAQENSLVYFEDSSNSSDDYLRNRIRHNIIPLMKKECNNLLQKASDYSTLTKESFDFIRSLSINYLKENHNKIDINSYKELNIALRKDIICLMLENLKINRNRKIIASIDEMLLGEAPQKEISLQTNYIFKKRYNYGIIEKEFFAKKVYLELNLGEEVAFDEKRRFILTKNLSNTNEKYLRLCYNNLNFPLIVRTRENSDTILMSYGHKKVKDLFIDKKIPNELRDSIPIVTDAKGNILWIVDLAKSKLVIDSKDNSDIFLVFEVNENGK